VIKSADKARAVPQLHVLTIQKLPRFLDRLSIVGGCEVLREGPMPVFVEEIDASPATYRTGGAIPGASRRCPPPFLSRGFYVSG
jgi:hypothetical protein